MMKTVKLLGIAGALTVLAVRCPQFVHSQTPEQESANQGKTFDDREERTSQIIGELIRGGTFRIKGATVDEQTAQMKKIYMAARLIAELTGPYENRKSALMSFDVGRVKDLVDHGAPLNIALGHYYEVWPACQWTLNPLGFIVGVSKYFDNAPELIEYFVSKGMPVDLDCTFDDKSTTLLIAVTREAPGKVIDTLLEHGADVNALNFDHYTPLPAAVWYNHLYAVKAFIARGVDPAQVMPNGDTIMHFVARNEHDNVEMYRTIVDAIGQETAKSFLATKDNLGWYPLHAAINEGNFKLAALFIRELHADINIRNAVPTGRYSLTPLGMAKKSLTEWGKRGFMTEDESLRQEKFREAQAFIEMLSSMGTVE